LKLTFGSSQTNYSEVIQMRESLSDKLKKLVLDVHETSLAR